ncbi:MAG: hypothetical protein GY780_07370 [bacterium]|nr:hypothetical protein [bacterium]
MKNTFSCPHCESVLNPSVKILLGVKYRNKKGLVLLSPQPGNYKFICDSSVSAVLKPGSTLNFFCPVCSADLVSPANKKFAEINLSGPGDHFRKVEFSRIFGTHATFIIDGDNITPFGDEVDGIGSTNFFGS